MSSSGSSTASMSRPVTPVTGDTRNLPSLERLVLHFVLAKRALNSTQQIEQATYLVADARRLIEEIAASAAKNAFATGKIHQQTITLHAIRRYLVEISAAVDDEFQIVISNLDAANDRLQTTLAALKDTVVDASLQRKLEIASADLSGQHDQSNKTLFDFVDESQYEAVSESLRIFIDSFQESRSGLENSLDIFKDSITEVSSSLDSPASSESPTIKATIYDEPLLPVSEAFARMEEHAAEMANLLHSLISHYDLCVSALKHTEGGGEAAKKAVLAGEDLQDGNPMDESLFGMKFVDPISDQERNQMLMVLEGDAEEVDEVVNDIKERGADMEQLHEQFLRRANTAKADSNNVREAVSLLQQIRQALPDYSRIASNFQENWHNIRASIDAKMQEIIGFRAFYEEFISGYKKLLREVDRRRAVQAQMRKLAVKAQKELDQLYKADKTARDEFLEDVASFLPSDLWHGVAESAVRWEVKATSLVDEEEAIESLDIQADTNPEAM